MEEDRNPFTRFSDIVPTEKMAQLKVVIIGTGGIGAPAALALAKTGVMRLEIWDNDTVDVENIGSQLHSHKSVGQPKTLSLARLLGQQAPWTEVRKINRFYTEEDQADADIIVSAVDSLQARRTIWATLNQNAMDQLLIDPRMGAELLSMHCVIPGEDAKWYADSLEGEAESAPCTAKATFYTGLVAGAMVAQAVKSWVCGELNTKEYHLDLRFLNFIQ